MSIDVDASDSSSSNDEFEHRVTTVTDQDLTHEQHQLGKNDDDDDDDNDNRLESSFFPNPSHYYTRYTDHNLALPFDALIKDEVGKEQYTRQELEKPNLDWILDDDNNNKANKNYTVFGQSWPIEERLPTLNELHVEQLYKSDQDRKQSLELLLKAFILTYHQLVNSLLSSPPSSSSVTGAQTDPERYVDRIRLIGINMHHLINELRPVQARETLKMLIKSQIETRRARTIAIKLKCQEMNQALSKLSTELDSTLFKTKSDSIRNDQVNERDFEDDRTEEKGIEDRFEKLKKMVDDVSAD